MKLIHSLLVAGTLTSGLPSYAQDSKTAAALPKLTPAQPEALKNWQDKRFGMFIHWGPVSLTGHEIGWSRGSQTPVEVYDNLYKQFNPTNFDAREWVRIAKATGMKYIVLTTKHHDGFCLWDTKQTDYNIMHSPFGRDVVKELAAACKKEGIAFGTYYSTCDWHHPDFPLGSPGGSTRKPNPNLDRYTAYLRAQVTELITHYGPLIEMWFDVPQEVGPDRGIPTVNLVRSLQPDILVNNRAAQGLPADFDTPEQKIGGFNLERPWETCMTICQQWAWKPNDRMKSLPQCLQTLILTAGGNGNLLFNVGPMPDGRIEPRQVERLKEMGVWMDKYGGSIYGTRGGPWMPTKSLASTRKGKEIFVHLLGFKGGTVTLPNLPVKIAGSSVLTGGKVDVKVEGDQLRLTLAAEDCRGIDTIVKLKLKTPALDIPAMRVSGGPGAKVTASASNVFQNSAQYRAAMAFDSDPETRWATDAGTKQAWIAADLGKPMSFSGVRIEEAFAGRVQEFEFQCKEGAEWKTIFAGTALGEDFARKFPEVKAQEVRLNILDATEGPTISEIQLEGLRDK